MLFFLIFDQKKFEIGVINFYVNQLCSSCNLEHFVEFLSFIFGNLEITIYFRLHLREYLLHINNQNLKFQVSIPFNQKSQF